MKKLIKALRMIKNHEVSLTHKTNTTRYYNVKNYSVRITPKDYSCTCEHGSVWRFNKQGNKIVCSHYLAVRIHEVINASLELSCGESLKRLPSLLFHHSHELRGIQ